MSGEAPPPRRGAPFLAPGLVVAALAVAVYLNALGNPFVYDDVLTVVENDSLRELGNWRYLLLKDRFRPLVNLSYALDFALWGLEPLGYHLTSVALHALNAVLFLGLAARLGRDAGLADVAADRLGFTAAALFAVHPLLVESVGYVSGRAEVLCATFSFLFLARMRERAGGPAPGPGLAAFAALLLALACKEVAAMAPFVLLAWERWLLAAPAPAPARRQQVLRLHLPLLVLVSVLGLARAAAFVIVERELAPRAPWRHALAQLEAGWRYLGLLVVPAGQSLVHQVHLPERPIEARSMFLGAALLAVVLAALRARRREPLAAVAAAWFFLFLLPSSSFIPLLELMAERRVYLASGGFFLAAALALVRLGARGGRAAFAAGAALWLALGILAGLTFRRNQVWSDPVRLWRDAAERAPAVWTAQYGHGDALRSQGDCRAAVAAYARAVSLLPAEPRPYINAGLCLARLGRADEARRVLEQAAAVALPSAHVHTSLASLAVRRGDLAGARDHYLVALAVDRTSLAARRGLVRLYEGALDDPATALDLCREMAAMIRRPDPDIAACIERLEARLAASGDGS